MTVAINGVRVTAADCIAMSGFAVDLLSTMSINGLIADDPDDAVGTETLDDEVGDDSGKPPGRPPSVREQSMKRRWVERLDQREQA